MYCQCIRNVSWMYYICNSHVYLMYYGCIGSCTPHLCFPPYSAHHLSGAQPMRASSFGNQQPMGLAPGGWGWPWHGSTRHAFWPAGHECSSMPCAVQQNPPLGRHPHGAPALNAPGLTHWSAVGGQTEPKRQWKVPAEYINAVFTMNFIHNPDVLTMYFEGIGCELTEKIDVLVEY
jgi:hypothetical protein